VSSSPPIPSARRCLEAIDTLVLAGGLGTRLHPVLGDVPKVLAPIADRPFLAYLLEWLKSFGARRVVLALGHRADAVMEYLHTIPSTPASIVTVIEPKPLGTAGAIRFARSELHTDPVLVVNGDTLAGGDLCALVRQHERAGACATVLCAQVDDGSRYGRVIPDREGRIQRFVEKDASHRGAALINAGVHLMSAAFLDAIASGQAASLERDVFEKLPAGSLAALPGHFSFIDIGTPESYASAASALQAWRMASE
jgi:NDP-sugar pyrophosphorylase family protein